MVERVWLSGDGRTAPDWAEGIPGMVEGARVALARVLVQIQIHDEDYGVRERLIWRAVHLARWLQYRAGVRLDPEEPAWPVVYIDLPEGQVSWHMPAYAGAWDGHDAREKRARVDRHAAAYLVGGPPVDADG